ncbi:PREDICTED: non-specific lipid-transfer protein 8 [Tarenaya hassleriana]|uniref:non-specific lipid-transfer protein 8 n=1 Tax=Tarenaya hassleriana TaxID=28532 RepID=UPI00053C2564|nr:PREDICTED: non-specific lipid-transfer protein 8 [Tarenaya hassleriana]
MNNLSRILMISMLGMFLFWKSCEATVSCSTVISDLQPCVNYLVNGSGDPPTSCCAPPPADKKDVCKCIKSVANGVTVKPELAKNLANNCGVKTDVLVSPDTDCSTIN